MRGGCDLHVDMPATTTVSLSTKTAPALQARTFTGEEEEGCDKVHRLLLVLLRRCCGDRGCPPACHGSNTGAAAGHAAAVAAVVAVLAAAVRAARHGHVSCGEQPGGSAAMRHLTARVADAEPRGLFTNPSGCLLPRLQWGPQCQHSPSGPSQHSHRDGTHPTPTVSACGIVWQCLA
jgi:hypothetical protein